MADNTKFTKRDREFIIALAGNIDKLRKDFDEFKTYFEEDEETAEDGSKSYRHKEAPMVHAEFYKTDDKLLQSKQLLLMESLQDMLQDLCDKNGIAYLSIEIDKRKV